VPCAHTHRLDFPFTDVDSAGHRDTISQSRWAGLRVRVTVAADMDRAADIQVAGPGRRKAVDVEPEYYS
jgi:hypothetical protein